MKQEAQGESQTQDANTQSLDTMRPFKVPGKYPTSKMTEMVKMRMNY